MEPAGPDLLPFQCVDTLSPADELAMTRPSVQRQIHRPTGRRGLEVEAVLVCCYPIFAGPSGHGGRGGRQVS